MDFQKNNILIRKKILIISYTYPPSNAPAAQRPYSIAKFLDKSKYDVTVLTCGNSDSSMGFDEMFDPQLPNVTLLKIDAFLGDKTAQLRKRKNTGKISTFKDTITSKLFKIGTALLIPDKAIFWYPKVKAFLKNNPLLFSETDILFTTSPMFTNHLLGLYINKKNKKIKWVSDFRDFHFIENLEHKKGISRFVNKRMERNVIAKSTTALFISKAMLDVYASRYKGHSKKMSFLYNGFDLEDFNDLKIDAIENNKLSIFYAGSFYAGERSPLSLFKIIDMALSQKLITIDEIEVLIAGNLDNSLLSELKAFKSFSSLSYLGCISRNEVLSRMTQASLLWLIVSKKITHYTGMPIKFYEYMAAGRPIINFSPNEAETNKIILDHNLGWSIDEEKHTIEEQLEIFQEIIKAYRSGGLHKSLNIEQLNIYNRKVQTKIFEKLIES